MTALKEKGLHHGNGNSLNVSDESTQDTCIITHQSTAVNNNLKTLRSELGISTYDAVQTVKELYPKFDKTLLCKCENDKYGVDLKPKAVDALITKYAPIAEAVERYKKRDTHRLSCRVSCRLEDDTYNQLMQSIKADGYSTMQEWLTKQINEYLKGKKK